MVLSGYSVHLSLSFDVVEALLRPPVSVAMVHTTSGVHYSVHFRQQLIVVPLNNTLSVLL